MQTHKMKNKQHERKDHPQTRLLLDLDSKYNNDIFFFFAEKS